MRHKMWALALPVLAIVAGCQTSADALNTVSASWVGKPADDFFLRYGPPQSQYQRQDGGRIYSWRGGEASVAAAAPPPPRPAFAQPAFPQPAFGQPALGQPAFGAPTVPQASQNTIFADSSSRTTSREFTRADGTRVTETNTRSSGVNVGLDPTRLAGAVLGVAAPAPASPPQRQVVCELNISADAGNTITSVSIQRDTQGTAGMSRCAELFR